MIFLAIEIYNSVFFSTYWVLEAYQCYMIWYMFIIYSPLVYLSWLKKIQFKKIYGHCAKINFILTSSVHLIAPLFSTYIQLQWYNARQWKKTYLIATNYLHKIYHIFEWSKQDKKKRKRLKRGSNTRK